MDDHLALDQDALGCFSKRFAAAVFVSIPSAQRHATMIRSGEPDGLSLRVHIPSPSKDDSRDMFIWVDEVATPTVGFGPSHTHFSRNDGGIVEAITLCQGILDDKVLIIQDVGGEFDGRSDWVDLRESDAIEDWLTTPHSSGRAIVKSWSGMVDREIGIQNL